MSKFFVKPLTSLGTPRQAFGVLRSVCGGDASDGRDEAPAEKFQHSLGVRRGPANFPKTGCRAFGYFDRTAGSAPGSDSSDDRDGLYPAQPPSCRKPEGQKFIAAATA
jgi:hypothetical protein